MLTSADVVPMKREVLIKNIKTKEAGTSAFYSPQNLLYFPQSYPYLSHCSGF